MKHVAFRIDEMDCGDEVAILKREIGPLVGGESNLAFDLLNRKMTITSPNGEAVSEAKIRKMVARAGMKAIPWTESCATGVCVIDESFRQRYGRLLMCLASGILLITGFLLHVIGYENAISTLAETTGEGHAFPREIILLYLGATITGAWFIVPKAFIALRRLRPDMNLLMTVAVIGAMAIGEWFESASVAFLFSLALLLESWSLGQARRAIRALVEVSPTTARFISTQDGRVVEREVSEVPVGARVLVRPGEKIPLDGVIASGETSVNQAPITGESLPVFKKVGDDVFAGTINGDGAIEFRSTKPAADTALARIIHMVEEAQSRRAPTEQWVEKFSRIYTPVMMGLAVAIAVVPPVAFGADWAKWFYEALVILVISCPCALAISTPVSIVAGITAAARNGVLIKGGAYLEAPARMKAVALDKTGTLTYGRPEVQRVIPMNTHTERELLGYAVAMETHSTHPLARAILERAESMGISAPQADAFTALPGLGAQASIAGKPYWIGSHRMLEQTGREIPQLHEMADAVEDAGHSLVILWCDDHVCGFLGVADRLRPEAAESIRSLKELGVTKVVMLTGDNEKTARNVAEAVGVDAHWAELLPEDKVKVVRELKKELGQVAVIGDGINDAPALAEASLGIAMGAMGTDAAIETADIALMSDDLSKLPWLIRHSRKALRIIKENIVFALGIKALFIALALEGIATLWAAIAADMGVSLLVIFNALRLLNAKHGASK
jgi:Cd2+/Zn2+-exporting ATPase